MDATDKRNRPRGPLFSPYGTRVLNRVAISALIFFLVLYTVLIVYPSYSGGLYRIDPNEILMARQCDINIPIYGCSPNDARSIVFAILALYTLCVLTYVLLPLNLVALVLVICHRRSLSGHETIAFLLALFGCVLYIAATYPIVSAFVVWVMD